jgi:hypothetical protein
MARDLLRRLPLRASELPPHWLMLRPGEPRLILCPSCRRWLRPHDGGLRRHTIDTDSDRVCSETGRRVFFDLTPAEWRARLDLAIRDAALRRTVPVQRKAMPPVLPPVFRLAGLCQLPRS